MTSTIGKFIALTFGLIGSVIALSILVLWGGIHTAIGVFQESPAGPNRVSWGLLLVGMAALASILVLFLDRIPIILFLIAGIGLFFVISGWAVIPLIFFLIAVMAFLSSRSERDTAPQSYESPPRPRTWDDLTPQQKVASQHAAWQQSQGRDPWGHPKR